MSRNSPTVASTSLRNGPNTLGARNPMTMSEVATRNPVLRRLVSGSDSKRDRTRFAAPAMRMCRKIVTATMNAAAPMVTPRLSE